MHEAGKVQKLLDAIGSRVEALERMGDRLQDGTEWDDSMYDKQALIGAMRDLPALLWSVRSGGADAITQKFATHVSLMCEKIIATSFTNQVSIMTFFFPALESCIQQLGENEKTIDCTIRISFTKGFAMLAKVHGATERAGRLFKVTDFLKGVGDDNKISWDPKMLHEVMQNAKGIRYKPGESGLDNADRFLGLFEEIFLLADKESWCSADRFTALITFADFVPSDGDRIKKFKQNCSAARDCVNLFKCHKDYMQLGPDHEFRLAACDEGSQSQDPFFFLLSFATLPDSRLPTPQVFGFYARPEPRAPSSKPHESQ